MTRLYLILTLAPGSARRGPHSGRAAAALAALGLRRLVPVRGIAILLAAAMNFLNRAYGRTAVGANLLTFSSAILGGLATHATPLRLVLVLALTGGLTLLSTSRRALR